MSFNVLRLLRSPHSQTSARSDWRRVFVRCAAVAASPRNKSPCHLSLHAPGQLLAAQVV